MWGEPENKASFQCVSLCMASTHMSSPAIYKLPHTLSHTSLKGDEPSAFPAHQPVLDPPGLKHNSFLTSSMEAYGIPEERRRRGREEREKREGEERGEEGRGGGESQD